MPEPSLDADPYAELYDHLERVVDVLAKERLKWVHPELDRYRMGGDDVLAELRAEGLMAAWAWWASLNGDAWHVLGRLRETPLSEHHTDPYLKSLWDAVFKALSSWCWAEKRANQNSTDPTVFERAFHISIDDA